MRLLSRRAHLAVLAVLDIALHARGRSVAGKAVAERLGLPARGLEPLLQTLVREGILDGARGPRGGYVLARERRRIGVLDIARAADGADADLPFAAGASVLAVARSLAEVEAAAEAGLAAITLEDLCRLAASAAGPAGQGPDFTI